MELSKGRISREFILPQNTIAKRLDISVVTLREYYQFLKKNINEEIEKLKFTHQSMTSTQTTQVSTNIQCLSDDLIKHSNTATCTSKKNSNTTEPIKRITTDLALIPVKNERERKKHIKRNKIKTSTDIRNTEAKRD